MSLMNEQRVRIHIGFCPMLCKLGKVEVPSLVSNLSTFSLTSYHLLPFKSIIWVVKSPFIAQVGCGLQASRLRQRMSVWLFSLKHRAQNSFVKKKNLI